MAVDNFIKGKRYILKNFDRDEIMGSIPCSYAKIKYNDGKIIELKDSYYEIYFSNDIFNLYDNQVSGNDTVGKLEEDITLQYLLINSIEFVFDYGKDSSITSVDQSYLPYCDLVSKKSLVSVWNSEDNYWYNLPCPSDYTGTSTTLVDSGRNTQGQVVGSVIASDIAKVELKWNFLLPEDYSFIAKLFEQKYGGSFFVAVSFFDTIKNDWDGSTETSPSGKDGNNPCRVFYCGDRKVSFAKMVLNDDGTPKGYSGVSLNLIDTGKYYGDGE